MKKTPYDPGLIFPAVTPLQEVIAEAAARQNNSSDPMAPAEAKAKAEVYKGLYDDALQRLSGPDMLTIDQAAALLSITVAEYQKKAEQGEVLLIQMEGKKVVPAWIFDKQGRIDELKLDIAREFALEGTDYFKFLDYFRFMTVEKADIVPFLPPQTLRDIYESAGLTGVKCKLGVKGTMNWLADRRDQNEAFFDLLIRHLDAALIHGGWDAAGGLSRPFRDKYKISGETMDERYAAAMKKPPAPPAGP